MGQIGDHQKLEEATIEDALDELDATPSKGSAMKMRPADSKSTALTTRQGSMRDA